MYLASSLNQPKFCPLVTWNSIATTFANISQMGSLHSHLFVDLSNHIYVATNQFDSIQECFENGTASLRNISCAICNQMCSLFVKANGDIFIDNGVNDRVEKWMTTTNNYTIAFDVPAPTACFSLFINQYDHFYC